MFEVYYTFINAIGIYSKNSEDVNYVPTIFVFSKNKPESDRFFRARRRAEHKASVGAYGLHQKSKSKPESDRSLRAHRCAQHKASVGGLHQFESRFEESVMEKMLEQNPEDSVHVATAEIEDKDPEDSEDSSHVNTEIENISDKEPEDSSHVDAVIDKEEPEDNDEEEGCDADTETDSSENELDGIIQEEESDVDVTNSGTISDILFYGEENADCQLPECVRELESIVETNEVEIGELQLQLDVLEDNYYNVLQENVSLSLCLTKQ